ncbi:ricin-type beta-trefoil lectin domain protein [Streptomyces sp. NBC_01267]|uniref:ricin-type beta-trefoil lectin domain protein n=1 Tax=Streptomyces sp. NBC_01267 TaxID=2903805 RepID=UPI002E33343F|nr:ricin-type beta-trefoil lectin domain protein [Streptomyces sp. NBC_01267]
MKPGTGRRAALAATSALTMAVAAGVAGLPAANAATAAGTTNTASTASTANTASTAAASGTVTLGGKCLDVTDGSSANGTALQLFDCNGGTAQQFSWADDGTLKVLGKCLDVTGGSDATGALVQLYDCARVNQQKFRYLPDGTIYSAKSGKCVAVQGQVVNHSRVGLASCDPKQLTQQWTAGSAPGPAYRLSGGAPVAYDNPDDTPAGVFTAKDGRFYYQQSDALYGANDPRTWAFFSGADFDSAKPDPISGAVNPANAQDRNDDTTWRCNNSPTGKEATPTPGSTGYAQPNYCDLAGVWVDPGSGDWYGLVHNEFTPKPFGDGMHYDGIDYAVSKDQGRTWSIEDHVITSPYSTKRDDTGQFPKDTYDYGDGDPRLYVDNASGYFYVFYADRVLNKSGGGSVWHQHVARAPIAQKMAPSSWRKWHDGTWQSPGTGGAESNIIPSDGNGTGYTAPADEYQPSTAGKAADQVTQGAMPDNSQLTVMNITWNAYLGKYIGTPQNNIAQATDTKSPLHFYATDDLATQKWVDMGSVAENQNASWYRWFLDSETKTTSNVVGRTFRSYCSFYCDTYTGEYADITIEPTSKTELPASPTGGKARQIKAANGRSLALSGGKPVALSQPVPLSGPNALAGPNALSGPNALAGGKPQKWQVTGTGDGFYTVTGGDGRPLRVADGTKGRAWGAAVSSGTAGAETPATAQWYLQEIVKSPAKGGASKATGTYRLVNRYSGLALSLDKHGSAVTAPQSTDPAQLLSFRS